MVSWPAPAEYRAGEVFRPRLIMMLAEGHSYAEIQQRLDTTAPHHFAMEARLHGRSQNPAPQIRHAFVQLLREDAIQKQRPTARKITELGMNAQDRTLRDVTSSRFRLAYNFCGGQGPASPAAPMLDR